MAAPSRALEKAKSLISTDFYEAQQMLKTVYHRQRTRKQLQESYETLKDGAILQLQAGHVTCGVELGILLVEALTTDGVVADTTTIKPLLDIINALPATGRSDAAPLATATTPSDTPSTAPTQAEDVEECGRLVSAVLAWANKQPTSWQAAQQVHAAYATFLWARYQQSQLQRLAAHLLRCGKPELHAEVLLATAPPTALDAYLTQAVLQVLAVARPQTKSTQLQHAKSLLATCSNCISPSGPKPVLFNFLSLLIEALERQSLPLVRLLRDRYSPVLTLDPTWDKTLDKIESVYLGVRRGGAGGGLGGLLGSLLQGMGGPGGAGGQEDDEEDGDNDIADVSRRHAGSGVMVDVD